MGKKSQNDFEVPTSEILDMMKEGGEKRSAESIAQEAAEPQRRKSDIWSGTYSSECPLCEVSSRNLRWLIRDETNARKSNN